MSRKAGTVDEEHSHDKREPPSREDVDAALARLQKIAEDLPPVDAVAIVREGRNTGSRSR
jgi:hypothetical protein